MKNPYKILTLFVVGAVMLKISFVFLATHLPKTDFSLADILTSVIDTKNIVELTNETRAAQKLPKLKMAKKLERAAQKKADDMLKSQYFAHVRRDGKTPWDFMIESGYRYLYAGENLAIHFASAEDVTEGWLASKGHKENILNDNYTEIGVGVARGVYRGNETTIVVQMFGRPLAGSALIGRIASRPIVKGMQTAVTAEDLRLLYISLMLSVGGILLYRYGKKKYYFDKRMSYMTLAGMSATIALLFL